MTSDDTGIFYAARKIKMNFKWKKEAIDPYVQRRLEINAQNKTPVVETKKFNRFEEEIKQEISFAESISPS